MTYGELCRRMSVREFAHWQALARIEAQEALRGTMDADAAAGAAANLSAIRRSR